jgi:hypothetical protein
MAIHQKRADQVDALMQAMILYRMIEFHDLLEDIMDGTATTTSIVCVNLSVVR